MVVLTGAEPITCQIRFLTLHKAYLLLLIMFLHQSNQIRTTRCQRILPSGLLLHDAEKSQRSQSEAS